MHTIPVNKPGTVLTKQHHVSSDTGYSGSQDSGPGCTGHSICICPACWPPQRSRRGAGDGDGQYAITDPDPNESSQCDGTGWC